jgi:hypothetical protein
MNRRTLAILWFKADHIMLQATTLLAIEVG